MKAIPILIVTLALPLLALGQTNDQQQGGGQSQKNEHQENSPAKKKKARQGHEMANPAAKPETGAMREKTNGETHASEMNKGETRTHSRKTAKTKVNKEEFKSSHREVFNLGRHPREFFVKRYGANHFRLIGNTYFVFVDGCWVAVDVAGFTFVQRVICEGDPDYIVVY